MLKKSFVNFIYRGKCGGEERKGSTLFSYVHQTVMLSVIVKCHYPILVSLLLPHIHITFFKSFMQITSNQLFSHLNGKVWSRMGAEFEKNYILFLISG